MAKSDPMEMNEITRQAIKAAGGTRALGERLGISQQAVQQWRRVPAERCLEVEQITGISRYVLRPDVYGPPGEGPNPKRRPAYRPEAA